MDNPNGLPTGSWTTLRVAHKFHSPTTNFFFFVLKKALRKQHTHARLEAKESPARAGMWARKRAVIAPGA